jgi:hypothetical protein
VLCFVSDERLQISCQVFVVMIVVVDVFLSSHGNSRLMTKTWLTQKKLAEKEEREREMSDSQRSPSHNQVTKRQIRLMHFGERRERERERERMASSSDGWTDGRNDWSVVMMMLMVYQDMFVGPSFSLLSMET